jgi:MYXO-CTERM domain-containing protein
MKAHLITFLAASLMALPNSNSWAQGFIVIMPTDSAVEANNSTPQPFSVRDSRFQQIYRLDNLVSPDVLIGSMVFRLDGTNGSVINGQMAAIQIRMSTTLGMPDSLSPVFADNIGSDQATVFSGTVQWFSNFVPGSPFPQALDLRINLQHPFLYRPSVGNLLVDFTVGNSTIRSQFDAWNRSSDSVSSVFGSSASPSGTASTLGLVTLFEGVVVPEPAPLTLALLGIAALTLLRRKRH